MSTSTVVVIDIEATCWPPEDPRRKLQSSLSEPIEIYAQTLTTSMALTRSCSFHSYIKPQEFPSLSRFCIELTGISQSRIDQAPSQAECLDLWETWLKEGLQLPLSSSHQSPVFDLSTVEVASWGSFDQKLLKKIWMTHRTLAPPWRHLDIKRLFERFCRAHRSESSSWYTSSDLNRISGLSLREATQAIKYNFSGPAHTAQADTLAALACLRFIFDESNTTPKEQILLALVDATISHYQGLGLSGAALYWGEPLRDQLGGKSDFNRLAKGLVERRFLQINPKTGGLTRTTHHKSVSSNIHLSFTKREGKT